MAWTATHRFCRVAPRKARLVVDMIRGMTCDQAVETLRFTNKRAAFLVQRILQSAMANANEKEAKMNRLFVSEARVDGGPIIKRFQPKDRGRAHAIQKKTSHIVIGVDERN
jgi:large subunit ribosomal protein L22